MTEEQKKKYIEDCEKSGNLDFPIVGQILSPICSICKNFNAHYDTLETPTCDVFGQIPLNLRKCESYDCSSFSHDKSSSSNLFFDENLQPIDN